MSFYLALFLSAPIKFIWLVTKHAVEHWITNLIVLRYKFNN